MEGPKLDKKHTEETEIAHEENGKAEIIPEDRMSYLNTEIAASAGEKFSGPLGDEIDAEESVDMLPQEVREKIEREAEGIVEDVAYLQTVANDPSVSSKTRAAAKAAILGTLVATLSGGMDLALSGADHAVSPGEVETHQSSVNTASGRYSATELLHKFAQNGIAVASTEAGGWDAFGIDAMNYETHAANNDYHAEIAYAERQYAAEIAAAEINFLRATGMDVNAYKPGQSSAESASKEQAQGVGQNITLETLQRIKTEQEQADNAWKIEADGKLRELALGQNVTQEQKSALFDVYKKFNDFFGKYKKLKDAMPTGAGDAMQAEMEQMEAFFRGDAFSKLSDAQKNAVNGEYTRLRSLMNNDDSVLKRAASQQHSAAPTVRNETDRYQQAWVTYVVAAKLAKANIEFRAKEAESKAKYRIQRAKDQQRGIFDILR